MNMESSESDEDEYLPETPRPQAHRGLTKKKTWLPNYDPYETKRLVRGNKAGNHTIRSNSEAAQVAVGDIRSENPRKLRKNSCDCEACGGEKLAKRMLFRVIPMQEIQKRVARMSSLGALGTLIQNCRSGSFIMPVIRGYRLSALIKPVPHVVFVSPPATPHLQRMMSSPSPRPIAKKLRKLQTRKATTTQVYHSPTLSLIRKSNTIVKSGVRITRGRHRTTPSTTNSETKSGSRARPGLASNFSSTQKSGSISLPYQLKNSL